MKMKKLLASLAASAMAVPCAGNVISASAKVLPAPTPGSGNVLYGDANIDGKVDIMDYIALKQLLENQPCAPGDTRYLKYQLTAQGMANVDVYNPGSGVTKTDADMILEYIVGKIPSLPVFPEKRFVDSVNNWSFRNRPENFVNGYGMLPSYEEKLFSGLDNADKESVRSLINSKWGGSCYGMAVTSLLSLYDVFSPSEYQQDASTLYEINGNSPTDEVTSLINYYFAVQATDFIMQKSYNEVQKSEYKKLQNLTETLAEGSPALMCFQIVGVAGHAIVGYAIEYGNYNYNDTTYDAKILTYDNNAGGYDDDCCLYYKTTDYSWYIPYYDISSNSTDNATYFGALDLCTADMNILNYHGYYGNSDTDAVDSEERASILTSAPLSTDYSISKIRTTSNSYRYLAFDEDEVVEYNAINGDIDTPSDMEFALKDANKGYMMELDENVPVDMSMRYENDLINVDSQSAGKVIFDSYGYAEVIGDDSDYNINIVSNDDTCVTDWYKVGVSGKASAVKFKKYGDGYVVESDSLTDITVSASNDDYSAFASFSTDYDKAYIYEIDENTIGIAVDTDNNGTFETTLNAD
jgi:hypothetical protein